MRLPSKPCLTSSCPLLAVPGGSRCRGCQRGWERGRATRYPQRAAYRDPSYRAIPTAGQRCADCGTDKDITRDHEHELHQGGSGAASNITFRCRSCNSKKSNAVRRLKREENERR